MQLNENNSKISVYYKEQFLLFSLFNNLKGGLQINDESFIFKSNKENARYLREYILHFLQNGIVPDILIQFNKLLFGNFAQTYFSLHNVGMSFDLLSESKIILKFNLLENKSVQKRFLLFINLYVEPNNKFYFTDISCNLLNKSNDVMFSFPIEENIIRKYLRTVQNKLQKFDVEIINIIF